MALRKISLALGDAALTGLGVFPVGAALPVRITNGQVFDATIAESAADHEGAIFDPDGVHVWVVESGLIRQVRISDGAVINSYGSLSAIFGIDKIDNTRAFVRANVVNQPFIEITFGGASPTVANIGTFKPDGATLLDGNPAVVAGDKVWSIPRSPDRLVECDLGGAVDPAPALRTINTPFNTAIGVGASSRLYADSTHLYLMESDRDVVHRWRLSDARYEGHHWPANSDATQEDEPLGLYLPDDGTAKIVRQGFNAPDVAPPVDVWTPIEQDTATVVNGAGLPVAIPDNDPGGVDIDVVVSGVGTIDGMAVTVDCPAHTFIGDLIVKVTHPNTTTFATLWNQQGAGLDGLRIELCDVSSIFRGLNADGTWKVNVADRAGGDTGSVTEVKLYFGAGGLVTKVESRDAAAANVNKVKLPAYDKRPTGAECWVDSSGSVRITGGELSASSGEAEWSYAPSSARIFRGVVLVGDLGRESTDAAEVHKTTLYYDVGVSKTSWTEIRPGEDPAVNVAVGETVFIRAVLDPTGGDQPWISEIGLLIDDLGNTGFEGSAVVEVLGEGLV